MLRFSFVQIPPDFRIICQGVHLPEEHIKILPDILWCFCADMLCNLINTFSWIEFKGLVGLLEISSIPVDETLVKKALLLDFLLFREINILDSLEIAGILCIDLFLDELFQPFWIWEESEILYDLQFLPLCVLRNANITALENLGAQIALIEVSLTVDLSSAITSIVDDHSTQMLVHFQLILSALLVVHILELVQVH